MFPTNTLLALARNKLKDAAWEREDPRPACQKVAAEMEREAREFLYVAVQQGWDGDVEAFINAAK